MRILHEHGMEQITNVQIKLEKAAILSVACTVVFMVLSPLRVHFISWERKQLFEIFFKITEIYICGGQDFVNIVQKNHAHAERTSCIHPKLSKLKKGKGERGTS